MSVMKKFGKNYEEMGARVAEARRKLRLTQVELAKQVDISQSALSMFEKGTKEALSDANIDKLLQVLEIRPAEADEVGGVTVKAYCPNEECMGAKARRVGSRVILIPRWLELPVDSKQECCELCGEAVVKKCQECKAPIGSGLNCVVCGVAYLQVVPAQFVGLAENLPLLDNRVHTFNAERASLLTLLGADSFVNTEVISAPSAHPLLPHQEGVFTP